MLRRVLANVELPEHLLYRLQSKYPELTFTVVQKDAQELYHYLADAEVLLSFQCNKAMVDGAAKLKWIQLLRAGLDGAPLQDIFKRGIILTSARGIHKYIMAEYAIAALINLSRNWHLVYKNQLAGKWDRSVPQGEINGATLGILGLGDIGKEIARKAKVFGMKVLAVKNRVEPVEGVDKIYGPIQMAEIFKESDYIINLLPLTSETEGLIDRKYFSLMKPTACFLNLGRGATVKEKDLVAALQAKQFHAAVLDVFAQEPLPADHPFWQLDNVILTPHFSGSSSRYIEKVFDIIDHNLACYLANEAEKMQNLVQSERGY